MITINKKCNLNLYINTEFYDDKSFEIFFWEWLKTREEETIWYSIKQFLKRIIHRCQRLSRTQ